MGGRLHGILCLWSPLTRVQGRRAGSVPPGKSEEKRFSLRKDFTGSEQRRENKRGRIERLDLTKRREGS